MTTPNIDESIRDRFGVINDALHEAQKWARRIGEDHGCTYCSIGVDLKSDGLQWHAHARCGGAEMQHAYAPNAADALEEAIRRAIWERDVNMTRITAAADAA